MRSKDRRQALGLAAACGLRLALELAVRAAHDGYTFLLSPTELARVEASLAWAKAPSLSPYGGVYWLPLQFALEGALLRLRADAFLVPFVVSAAAGVLTVAAVFTLALEWGGFEAALAAGLAFAASAVGLVFGVGGTADPLLHAGLAWSLVFWARFERSGRGADLWKGGICLTLAGLARFEAWPAGAAAAAMLLWKRRRGAWRAAAWAAAAPLAWIVYCRATTGDALSFVHQTLSADILRPLPRAELFESFCRDFLALVPAWLIALAALGAAGLAEAPAVLWAAEVVLAACFILPSPWAMTQVDEHPLVVAVLALPIAAAVLAGRLRALEARRRAFVWGAAAILYLASQFTLWRAYESYFEGRQGAMAAALTAERRLRSDGRLAPGDAVLVELPVERRTRTFFGAWRLESPPALFDRRLDYGPEEMDNPSLLDGGARSLSGLRARGVRLIVAGSRRERLRAAGLVELPGAGPLALMTWPDDPLARSR